MQIEGNGISLCLTYQRKDDRVFYRFADFDPDTGVFNDKNIKCNEVKYVYSSNSYENYSLGDICFRKWKCITREDRYDSSKDYTYTLSDPYNEFIPIEVVKQEFYYQLGCTTEYILHKLRKGISLDKNVSRRIFLILSEENGYYKALFLDLQKMKINSDGEYYFSDNCSDMLHTKHLIEVYNVPKKDVFSTLSIKHKISDDENIKERYFYKKICIDEKITDKTDFFHLFSVDEYYSIFFKRYLKSQKAVLNLSNREIANFIGIIESIQTKNDEFKQFIACSQYTDDEISKALSRISEQVISDLKKEDIIFHFVSYAIRNDEVFRSECLKETRKAWLSENNKEQQSIMSKTKKLNEKNQSLIQKNEELQYESKELNEQIVSLNETIQNKNTELNSITEEVQILEERKQKLNIEIKEELDYFKDNLAHTAAISFISGQSISAGKVDRDSLIFVDSYDYQLSDTRGILSDTDEFLNCLSDNLRGICKCNQNFSYDIAKIISAELNCGGNFVIYGNSASDIADSISMTMYSKGAVKITLPLNSSDIPSLMNEINAIDSNVIFIENAFDCYNDYLALSLLRRKSSKCFVFAINNKSTLNLLKDSNIWEYAIYINIDNIIVEKENLSEICSSSFSFLNSKINKPHFSMFENKYNDLMTNAKVKPPLRRHLKRFFDSCFILDFIKTKKDEDKQTFQDEDKKTFYGIEFLLWKMLQDGLLNVNDDEFDAYLRKKHVVAYNKFRKLEEN